MHISTHNTSLTTRRFKTGTSLVTPLTTPTRPFLTSQDPHSHTPCPHTVHLTHTGVVLFAAIQLFQRRDSLLVAAAENDCSGLCGAKFTLNNRLISASDPPRECFCLRFDWLLVLEGGWCTR